MEISAIVTSVPLSLMFIFIGTIINLIQVACYLTIRPLSKSTFRRINGAVSEVLWLELVWLMEWWSGCEVKLHTDLKTYRLMGKEHALLMPIFGWTTWFYEFIFVDRNWAKDGSKLKSSFQALKDFPIPFWVTIFAEGTRLTPDKLLEAQTFASTKGLAIPKNVLIPRTKGFVTAVQSLRSFVPALYDVTIAIQKGHPSPSLLRFLKRQPCKIKVHIKRYSMKELPESDEGIAQWCRNRFIAKDALLDKFAATGRFDEEEITDFRRSTKSLIVFLITLFLFSVGAWISCQKFSLLSNRRGYTILATIVGTAAIFAHIFLEFTKLPPQKCKATLQTNGDT
ncbi:Lysophosphatidyl acyltransferase 2, putative isoform 3 [Theobroma cacao]|uniref:1-acylglycerol-3-phosphate O-acyltransferase n=1 Tax=Theobroma cacao TaxID=3641 RepID=A0A061GTE2_THECC|nr:Lysophosphatidyl acyltransferase 2, putative isoform 3 [Theobroma cacao]